jgi:hypothetical protein
MSDPIDAERSGTGGVTRAEGEAGEEGPPVAADAQLEHHSPRPVWFGDVDLDAAGKAGAVPGLGVAALELIGRQPLGGELVAFSLGERPKCAPGRDALGIYPSPSAGRNGPYSASKAANSSAVAGRPSYSGMTAG